MFLIKHFIALHRKVLVRLAIATYVIGTALQILFVYLGLGFGSITLVVFPFMTTAVFVYLGSFLWHFRLHNVQRAQKAAAKARKLQQQAA